MDFVSCVWITHMSPICETYQVVQDKFLRRIWSVRRIHLPWVRQMLQSSRRCSVPL